MDGRATAADRRAAFGGLVDRHADRVHDTLAKLLGDPHEASDAAQEAFLKAWRKLHTFRGDSSFRTWLTRIALNAAASRRRTAARRGTRTGLPPGPREDVRAAAPDAATLGDERDRAVRAAVAELAEEFRVVVVLKEFEELSYEAIAEIVDVPVGTVRSRLHRGRAELKRRLAPLLRESAGKSRTAEAPR
ncbi:ECF RNA polymerase sigma factor SigW [Alienimonas californiensis]|uniref:ECF RNA polymerase sigma factor SigW n=1 Tax=Alienimonas californiensis TaxID=2527989 RepID=A0A517PET4_9PLAN|nr:ECF RNA polymerase sigma factor SigW [Alienimonas californiensis]